MPTTEQSRVFWDTLRQFKGDLERFLVIPMEFTVYPISEQELEIIKGIELI